MPVVTTPIGSKGMTLARTTSATNHRDPWHSKDHVLFGGRIAWTIEDFVRDVIELAVDKEVAKQASDLGRKLL